MTTTCVVNGRRELSDVNITRREGQEHYGSPFSHLATSRATVLVTSREEAVARHRTWLEGTTDTDVEPERRAWILANLEALRGKRLGCYCKPKACHGDNYVAMLEARS
jgi:hypothetical protein